MHPNREWYAHTHTLTTARRPCPRLSCGGMFVTVLWLLSKDRPGRGASIPGHFMPYNPVNTYAHMQACSMLMLRVCGCSSTGTPRSWATWSTSCRARSRRRCRRRRRSPPPHGARARTQATAVPTLTGAPISPRLLGPEPSTSSPDHCCMARTLSWATAAPTPTGARHSPCLQRQRSLRVSQGYSGVAPPPWLEFQQYSASTGWALGAAGAPQSPMLS